MRGVNFDDVECGIACASRGLGEGLRDGANLVASDFAGLRIRFVELDGAGRDHISPAAFAGRNCALFWRPGAIGAGFASGVRELNAGETSLVVNEADDGREGFGVTVAPDAEVFGADAGFGRNGGGFAKDDCGASDGAAAKVDEVPVVGEPVLAGVLAHRRNSNAVAGRCGANLQRIE